MPRLILSLPIGSLVVCLICGCSQNDQLAEEVERLRLAVLLSQYRLDVKDAKTFEDVDHIYRRGQQLAIELKRYLPPAALPLYQARIDTSLLYRDGVLVGLEQRTRIAEEAAKKVAEKKRLHEEATEAYNEFFDDKATYRFMGGNPDEDKKRQRAYSACLAAKKEYVRAEQEYIKAQEQVRDVEESYMFGLVRAWEWLDLYMNQLVQYEDAKAEVLALGQ